MRTQTVDSVTTTAFGLCSVEQRLGRIKDLNLTNVKRKLMEPYPEGKGWNQAQVDEAEVWYKRYLAAIVKFPDRTRHVPNGPIDFFWHQHILDTKAYGRDMMHCLGFFLHHYPYFGLNGDATQRDDSFEETNAIYREMFGEDCTQMKTFGFGEKIDADFKDGKDCHGENCSQGCSNCGRDNRVAEQLIDAPGVFSGDGRMENCCSACSCAPDRMPQPDKVSKGEIQYTLDLGEYVVADGQLSVAQTTSSFVAKDCFASKCSSCGHEGPVNRLRYYLERADFGRPTSPLMAQSCNDAGSGTGCGQGCSRGG